MTRLVCWFVVAWVIACGDNKEEIERKRQALAAAGLAPPATVAAKCTKLLPQALIEKHLAGFAFDAGSSAGLLVSPGPGTLCVYRKAASPGVDAVRASISFAPGTQDSNSAKLDAMVKHGGAREIAGIGRRAVHTGIEIEFWATHTDCVVALPANEQLAKDLDATLTSGSCE